ncbi:hypothetical protein ONZ43_g5118 [Nemania bipapillata]|uniref:Uncharacterized protein n=1 Tax=Nemania bipapillata TaxID=110536 RepID=A0ACC2IEH6_9PEZI|nr:hypothetical protein ONZ43_g5118 [Nemania bipapillata]
MFEKAREEKPKREKPWGLKAIVSRLKKKTDSELEDFMVIGIDFGTTYSGVAWATVADFENDQINLITSWPDWGREEGKAPTELFYENNKVMWGYGIPADAEPIRWFKLLLLREEDLPSPELRQAEYLLRARRFLREQNKTAIDLIADFLRCLWQHILVTIQKARKKTVVDGMVFHVVLTVPAIWKGYARQAMEDAARKAGILDFRPAGPTTLAFAPEPEAAALATICELRQSIKKDEVYVICDAGGGTVDLISYQVNDTDPIALNEAVLGTGGLCGGIFIDEAFENICKNRLGRRWGKLSQTGVREIMRNEWEYAIKPQYRVGDGSKEYIVAVPAEAFKDGSTNDDSRKPIIKEGRIYFSSSDIQAAFEDVFSEIHKLVDGQIRKAKENKLSVVGIVLVGGLGSSPYLYDYLSALYEKKGIDVMQSTGVKPRTAICRGAIFKGFLDGSTQSTAEASYSNKAAPKVASAISVTSTIARQSLGVTTLSRFSKDTHLEQDKVWDSDEECYFAEKQMTWYLTKGQNVQKLEPVRHDFYKSYASETAYQARAGEVTIEIKQCFDDTAPARLTDKVGDLCTITIKHDVAYEELADFHSDTGKKLKKFNYVVEMIPSGASMDFAIIYNDIKLGSQNAKIQFE